MTKEDQILEIICSDFPLKELEIRKLFSNSVSFIEVCEDYVLCKKSIIRLATKKDTRVKTQIYSLEMALSDLKTELLNWITTTKKMV